MTAAGLPDGGTAAAPGAVPLPVGFRIELHPDVREIAPGEWFGGSPARVLRLTGAGRLAWEELRRGPVHDRATGLLARRLVEAGIAHPIAPPTAAEPDVTVVVPVHAVAAQHARAGELDRCLASLGRAVPVIVVDDASPDELGVRSVAARHGARVVRLAVNAGPAAARNAGLDVVTTDLVAFVDSDTEPGTAWITGLAGQLADPLVAAVAPRVVPTADPSAAGRYTQARGSLDLGDRASDVRTYGPVAYVPTAALLARTRTLRDAGGFDTALRYGEDVDLVWRLTAQGHRVRYLPSVQVPHHDPATWRGLLARRFRYGTSAAPLAERHPASLAPLVVHPWYTATVLAVLARSPWLAAPALAGTAVVTRRALADAGVPARHAPRQVAEGLRQTWLGTGGYFGKFALPVLLAGLARRRTRLAAASLLLGPPLTDWATRRPGLDPLRYVTAALADDAAYGAGVLAGCVTHRTTVPLRPVRARTR